MENNEKQETIKELVLKIKQSKKYKHISESVILGKVLEYVKRNPKFEEYKEKFILKEIKAMLHSVHGSFQFSFGNKLRKRYLEELKKDTLDLDIIDKILETNKSTKERLGSYEEAYREIFKITGKPNAIVDLGCGLNPVAFLYMNLNRKAKYYAYDINEEDNIFLNAFFELEKEDIVGKAELINLQDINEIERIPKCDLCLMFKLVDVIEKNGHKHSEAIITKLADKCKFIVVSFATSSLGGKFMNFPERGWIERMLTRLNFKFEMFELENEIFYVIWKD